jgi:BON domain
LLLVTALGATVGFLTGMGLFSELHDTTELEFFLLRVSIAGLAAYVLFDPGMEVLQDRLAGKRPKLSGGRKIFSVLIIVLATVVISLFHESLVASIGEELKAGLADLKSVTNWLFDPPFTEKLAQRVGHLTSPTGGFELALGVFVFVGIIAGFVSHSWVSGASKKPPRAALYGSAATGAGAVYLVVGAILLWAFWLAPGTLHSRPWAIAGIFLVALLWFLGGLLGGVAIDKHSPRHGLTFRAFVALALPPAILLLLLLVTYELKLKHAFPNHGRLLFLPILALLCQNLGWALALHLRCDACGLDLGLSEVLPPKPSEELEEQKSGAVLPFRREDGLGFPGSGVGQTATARAKDLVLRPKGDRLLAAVALMLALVTSGLAFYVGFFRTDTEIVNNVQLIFLQDSGLRRAGLTVHSSGRVVMISGVVEDETEHAAAVQRALSVRGVKQLIDQIQVTPSQPHPPITPTPAEVVPSQKIAPPAPSINATISLGGAAGPGKAARPKPPVTAGSQKLAEPPKAAESQKQTEATKPADSQKHRGLLGLLKKGKNNVTGSTTDAHKADTQKPDENSKSSDTQKHGLFHFLKKDKNKENNKVQPNKNDTKNKKNTTKDPTAH